MLRPLSIAAAGTGVAAVLVIACSGSVEPATAFFRTPGGSSSGPASSNDGPTLTRQESGTTVRIQAISPVNDRVVWASGREGTFLLTKNGGRNWKSGVVPGAETLQFRDVEGVSDKVAYLLSIGAGTDSRIYKTVDGGKSWDLQFQNQDPNAFYDCFDFWDASRGITFSDAVGNRFPVIKTTNGKTWQDIGDRLPAAQPGEASFAASGTCVTTQGDRRAWIGTSSAERARVLATTDAGATWTAALIPDGFRQGTGTSGIASVAFRDRFHGILGGGDVADTPTPQVNVARSNDGGATWTLTTPTPFTGAVYGLSYVPGHLRQTVVATGPGGAAWTPDEGDTWSLLPGVTDCWAVAFASRQAGWLACAAGGIIKVSFDGRGNSHDGESDVAD